MKGYIYKTFLKCYIFSLYSIYYDFHVDYFKYLNLSKINIVIKFT